MGRERRKLKKIERVFSFRHFSFIIFPPLSNAQRCKQTFKLFGMLARRLNEWEPHSKSGSQWAHTFPLLLPLWRSPNIWSQQKSAKITHLFSGSRQLHFFKFYSIKIGILKVGALFLVTIYSSTHSPQSWVLICKDFPSMPEKFA